MGNLSRRLDKLEAAAPSSCSDPLHGIWRVVYDDEEPGHDPGPANCPTCNTPRPVIQVQYQSDWRGVYEEH